MLHDHSRFKVVSKFQHIYNHFLGEFLYSHPALPDTIVTAEDALNYVFDVLYPRIQASVEAVTELPTVGNNVGDQRIVQGGRLEILSAGVNSDLVNGVLELAAPPKDLSVGDPVYIGNVSNNKTAGFPDSRLYVGAITAGPDTLTLYEDSALTTLADLSGLGLVDGPVETLTNDSVSAENAEIWIWSQFDGQPLQWNKVADVDWGVNSVVQALMDQTQYLYVRKFGITDFDGNTGLQRGVLNGEDALYDGQHIYGGDTASQNLILHAANGGSGGYIVFDDPAVPIDDLVQDFGRGGATPKRWNTGYFGTLVIGTASLNMTADANDVYIFSTSANDQILLGNPTDPTADDVTSIRTYGTSQGANLIADTDIVIGGGAAGTADGRITIGANSITTNNDSLIDFADAPLTTGGELESDTHTITDGTNSIIVEPNDGDLVTPRSSITTDLAGGFTFGTSNIITSGTFTAGATTLDSLTIDDTTYDANGLTTTGLPDKDYTINPSGDLVISSNTQVGANNITGIAGSVIEAETIQTLAGVLSINGDLISTSNPAIRFGDPIAPATNGSASLGTTASGGLGWSNLYFQSGASTITHIGTGDAMSMTTLLTFRDASAGLGAGQAGHALFWDGTKWSPSAPDLEIDHEELAGLHNSATDPSTSADAGHPQFVMLEGRTGGQIVNGGTLTSQTLTLHNNDVDDLGVVVTTSLNPITATYDLGASGSEWRNLYMTGELIGSRAENDGDPTANLATTIGRLAFNTTTGFLEVSDGGQWNKVGNNSYIGDFNQTTLVAAAGIDVAPGNTTGTGEVDDAQKCIWQVIDVDNGHEVMGLKITKPDASTVRVWVEDVGLPTELILPAGTYRLIGIEA